MGTSSITVKSATSLSVRSVLKPTYKRNAWRCSNSFKVLRNNNLGAPYRRCRTAIMKRKYNQLNSMKRCDW
jgi:hypothetical protein